MTPKRRHHMVCEDVHNACFHIRTRLSQCPPFLPMWDLISSYVWRLLNSQQMPTCLVAALTCGTHPKMPHVCT